ncbi:pyocin knob domain-containing protein [Providencia hangzhouensis]|uniref:pyocin knob domain-containing protein n=1 Tax=Providencia hangzhouensis TaxID=3031799 RepID=UPI0039F634B4
MAKNEFLPFGIAEGANVLSNQEYERLAARFNGFISGVAKSKELNTVWRQSSVMSSALAQFIVDSDNQDLIDNGDVASIKTRLVTAIKQTISGVGYVTTAAMNLELNKKFDKANISGVKGNDNDKVPSLNLFTTEIGKLPTKADLQNITSQTIFARAEAIPQNADLNDYTNAGLFYQASSNPGANAKNYPPNSSAGSLEIVRTGTTSVKQVYTDWYDKKTYTRRYNGGNKTWADKWDEDYTKLNPPTPAELNVYSIPQADNKFQPKGNYQPKGDYVDKTVTGEQVIKGSMTVNSAFYVTSDGAGSDLLGLVTWGGAFGFRKRINGTYGGTVEVPYQGGTIALVEQTIGINQTWKNLTSSRSAGVSYTNTSNKPILVALTGQGEGDNSAKITVDNVTVAILGGIKIYSINRGVSFIVPPGSKYLVESTAVIAVWSELS